jgi:hypothetical protein
MKNKAVLCKPLTMTKATYCKPHMQSKSCQTGNLGNCDFYASLNKIHAFLEWTGYRIDLLSYFVLIFTYLTLDTALKYSISFKITYDQTIFDKGLEYTLYPK